ncbi:non-ribosomal peptide synthetase [Acidisphaera sp. S103]|uniref:non-ribosomal peptide synthetase n=1 Tax=Acidisphaera sp. S103 TaxID=1747223 RepID=UPI00131E6449|nr:non-ribosomal peptide synthetase [Acidisphaera sp. S103]
MNVTFAKGQGGFARYTGRDYETHRAFWTDRLAAIEDPIVLDGGDSAATPGEHAAPLSAEAEAVLRRISAGSDLGRFVVVLAALARVMAAHGGGRSILVDVPPLAAMPHAGETLPLTLPLRFDGSVRDLLGATRDVVSACGAHQDFPVRRLAAADLPAAPVFVASAALHGPQQGQGEAPVGVVLAGDGLTIRHADGSGAAAALLARIDRALVGFADTGRMLAEIELLSDSELAAVLRWGQGPAEVWAPAMIWSLFRDCAIRHAGRVALRGEGRTLTYGELLRDAEALGAVLRRRHGVRPDVLVGLMTARRVEWIVGLLGILCAGGAYLPLSADQPRVRRAAVLDEARPRLVLSSDPRVDEPGVLGLPFGVDPGEGVDGGPSPTMTVGNGHAVLDGPGVPPAPEDLAYVLYTSGSTGQPKGVMIEHGGFANMIRHQIATFGVGPQDRVLQLASASFDASLSEIFMTLLAGAALVLIDEETIADKARFVAHMAAEGVTVATITPAYLAALDGDKLATLRVLIVAGDTAIPDITRSYARDRTVFNAYGPTEVSVCASIHRVAADAGGSIPVGRAVANSRIYVLDGFGRPVAPGATGQIVFAGPGVARGYLGRVSEAFVDDPFRPAQRAYRTGDLGRFLADGALDFLGRDDRQVKIRGHRVEPAEIEQALLRHDLVREAHVAPVRAPGGQTELAAWVALREPVELWPSIAEFFVYDDLAYGAMAGDEQRNAAYRAAFIRHLPGKTVLEIGPGAEAVLTRMAVEAGARKVYAVEISPKVAEKARARIAQAGMADRVEVIVGDITRVMLPERADVCISEIVGSIGGSEGSAVLIEASRRWLRDPAAQLPARSLTRLAGVALGDRLNALGFPETAASYLAPIFAQQGGAFDLRLCLKNLPEDAVVTSADVLEDLDYRGALATGSRHDIRLDVTAAGRIDGLLAWLRLIVDADHPEEAVDIMESVASWLPVYLPLAESSPPLVPGDTVVGTVTRSLSANGINPNFRVEGTYRRGDIVLAPFVCDVPHVADGFRGTPLHRVAFDDQGEPRRLESPLERVRDHLRQVVPAAMVPAHIVRLPRLPLNASGKIDRNALPAPSREPVESVAPRSALEETLCAVFAEVLGVDRLGIEDDFFAMGGDSIRAIQIAARLGARGVSLVSADILQYRSVAALAPHVSARSGADASGPVEGPFPPTPIQTWFVTQFSAAPHHFNQALLLRTDERLDPVGLGVALDAVVAHHDALRARFWVVDGVPRGEIPPHAPGVVVDVENADADGLPALCARSQASLDIGAGPLFRVTLLRMADGDRVLWVIHHLAVDWVSWRILLGDLEQAYRQWQAGASLALPPRTASFIAWADQVAVAAADPAQAWERERAYWGRVVGGPLVQLPGGNGEDLAGDTASVVTAIPADVTAALLGSANRVHGTETIDLLLAGLARAMRDQAGPGRFLVMLEGHGRESALAPLDVSRTVGWFTSFYPLALDLDGAETVADQVRAVRDAIRSVPRRGVGYLLLADGMTEARPQIGFNYLGRLDDDYAGSDRLFRLAEEPAGPVCDQNTRRPLPLDLLASVADGCLHVALNFNRRHFAEAAMQRFLDSYAAALAAIAAGGEAASDLPDLALAGIGADELDSIMQDWT